jgi:lipoprotein NlpI
MKSIQQNIIKNPKLVLLVILVFTIIAYFNTLGNDVLSWDDTHYVSQYDILPSGIEQIFTTTYMDMYQPLTVLSFWLDHKIWGDNPLPYHLSNLLLHLLNTVLVFIFVALLCRNNMIASITAALFAFHPMHVESVAWISERKDLASSFFALLALISYVYFLARQKTGRYIAITLVFYVCSLLVKPQFVLLPFILMLIDFYQKRKGTRVYLEKIPFIIVMLGFMTIGFLVQKGIGLTVVGYENYTVIDRLFFASYGFLFYIYKMFIPYPLSGFYAFPEKSQGFLPLIFYISPAIILLGLFLILKMVKNHRHILFGLLFYSVTLVLVLQLFPFGPVLVAEHYTYIPYIGLFIIIGYLIAKVKHPKRSNLVILGVSGILILFVILTWNRTRVWKNDITFYTDIIKNNPGVPAFYNNRGLAFNKKDKYAQALEDLNRAIELDSTYVWAYCNRGIAYYGLGDYDQAFVDFKVALSLKPDYPQVYNNIGLIYLDLKMKQDAVTAFETALEYDPDFALACINLDRTEHISKPLTVDILLEQTVIYYLDQRYQKCIHVCDQILDKNPNNALALNNMCACYVKLGEWSNAIKAGERALELDSELSAAKINLEFARKQLEKDMDR